MNEIQRRIQDAWRDEQCPGINGILFASGAVVLFDYQLEQTTLGPRVRFGNRTDASLSTLLEQDSDLWVFVTSIRVVDHPPLGLRLLCGEGEHGSYGFVAATRMEDGFLEWIGLFLESNPFRELRVEGEHVIATSTYDQEWRFSLRNPADLRID